MFVATINAAHTLYINEFAHGAFGRDFDRCLDEWQYVADRVQIVCQKVGKFTYPYLITAARLAGRYSARVAHWYQHQFPVYVALFLEWLCGTLLVSIDVPTVKHRLVIDDDCAATQSVAAASGTHRSLADRTTPLAVDPMRTSCNRSLTTPRLFQIQQAVG
ncbi:hypothetical protein H6F43_03760 [Leptolyngbya sp. FACHB-36]|uniref:hypothetical protein n=1 Tax=Leptolyngbya sp. FACHB-36 TaxID=2692808 RepID=UPI001680A19F|nr:hypothetical protein [Leptolyngbya sp. FACHB-36]MBD2019298.1 hypothetical protein [Leptolyngbya sp. FACHB-36]